MKHCPYISRTLNEVADFSGAAYREQPDNFLEIAGMNISLRPAGSKNVALDRVREHFSRLRFEFFAGVSS